MPIENISPQHLHDLFRQGRIIDLIDVRSPSEYEAAHVEAARLMPMESVTAQSVRAIRRGGELEPVYVICQGGVRSMRVCGRLAEAGMKVANVEGGTSAWIKAGLPVVGRGKVGGARGWLRRVGLAGTVVLLILGLTVSRYFLVAAGVLWLGMATTLGCCPLGSCSLPRTGSRGPGDA